MADAEWEKLQKSGRIRERSLDLGTALPEGDDPRAVHAGVRKSGTHFDWHLHYFAPPKSQPPESVKESSERLKGPRGLAELLEAITSFGSVGRVDLRISFQLPVSGYATTLIPEQAVPASVQDFSPDAAVEQVGYRFGTAPLGIQELVVIYEHNLQTFNVQIMALCTLNLAIQRSVPFAATIANQVVETFFSRRS